MTVEQFQQVYEVSEFEINEWDKAIQMCMVFTGKTEAQVEAMNVWKFNRICKKINKAFKFEEKKIPKTVRVGARFYKINLNVTEMKARKYVEGIEFGKQMIKDLHKYLFQYTKFYRCVKVSVFSNIIQLNGCLCFCD